MAAHESAVAPSQNPFTPAAVSPPVTVTGVPAGDVQTFTGPGGGPDPYAGMFDHQTSISPVAKAGTTGMSGSVENKAKTVKGKAGFVQSTKGAGMSGAGSFKRGKNTYGASVATGPEGTALGLEREKSLGGDKTSTTGLGYNTKTGETTASYGRKIGEGPNAKGASLETTFGENVAKVKVKATKGDNGASLGAGISRAYGLPTLQPDGQWAVTYSTTIEGSAGGNSKHVSAGAEGARSEGGTRLFATEQEAKDFTKSNGSRLSDDPADLRVGETMTKSIGGKLKAGGEGAFGGALNVGGGIAAGKSKTDTVTKIDAETVQVVVSRATDGSGNLSAGAGPASTGVSGGIGKVEDKIYRFDLSTAEGRAALEHYHQTGEPPPANLVGFGKATTTDLGRTAGLGIVGVGTGGKLTERTDTDLAGHTAHTHTGTRTKNSSLVGLGQHTAVTSLTAGVYGTDIAASVRSSDGRGSMEELAEATGTKAQGTSQAGPAVSSGTWTVESHMDDDQLAALCAKIAYPPPGTTPDVIFGLLLGLSGDGKALQAELKNAKNGDECKRAMARFVAETGGKGAAWLRQIGGVTDYDVRLDNDENFTGAQGREALDGRLWAHHRSLEEGNADPAAIKSELATLRKRMTAITDPKRYTDLPADVRQHEVEKLQGFIWGFERIEKLANAKK